MLNLLRNWTGNIEIDGIKHDSVDAAICQFHGVKDVIHIKLCPKELNRLKSTGNTSEKQYKIEVKQYMTRKATPEFDFMAKWNNDNPMPLRIMTGTKEKETRGMVYMKLRGLGEPVITCMRCGRQLTNPISKKYGIGPECMSKLGFTCDINDVDIINQKLCDIEWEGWIIKSAIVNEEEVNG